MTITVDITPEVAPRSRARPPSMAARSSPMPPV